MNALYFPTRLPSVASPANFDFRLGSAMRRRDNVSQVFSDLVNQGESIAEMTRMVSNIYAIADLSHDNRDMICDAISALHDGINELRQNVILLNREHTRVFRGGRRRPAHAPDFPTSLPSVVSPANFEPPPDVEVDFPTILPIDLPTANVEHAPRRAKRATRTRIPKSKVRVVRRDEFDGIMSDSCGICLDTKTRGETITTSCGHPFCKDCFHSWSDFNVQNGTLVSCPCCRTRCEHTTEVRLRKKKSPTIRNFTPDNIFLRDSLRSPLRQISNINTTGRV